MLIDEEKEVELSNAIGALSKAILELVDIKKPTDGSLEKTLLESLSNIFADQKTDLTPITETNKAILSAIQAINSSSNKTNSGIAGVVLSIQEQNKELIEVLKKMKGTDKYEESFKKIIETIVKSNDTIAKSIKMPDYSKEITALTEAIKSRPTSYEITYTRNAGWINSARITPIIPKK